MRVLFITFAASSHLNLMVPVAWALRAAGHQVCVASQPNLYQEINDAGLTAISVGNELDMARHVRTVGQFPGERSVFDIGETRAEKLTWDYVRGALTLYSTAISGFLADQFMLEDLVCFSRAWEPDLVIWDALTYVGPVAARVCGAAHARMLFGPDHLGRMRGIFHRLRQRQPSSVRDDPMGEWLAGRLALYGAEFDEDVVTGQRTLDPMPSWMRLPAEGIEYLSVRFVPYAGRAPFPDWIHQRPQRPRVCLTLGLAARAYGLPGPPVEELLAAVADLDIEVIATLNAEQLRSTSTIPGNVRLIDLISLEALLPTCSAIIHHLGAGTMATAVLHGTPQIRVSDGLNLWGEPGMAQQLVERGAALNIDANALTPDTLATRLTQILNDPAYQQNAAQLKKEMLATASPHDIVPELEALAATHKRSATPLAP